MVLSRAKLSSPMCCGSLPGHCCAVAKAFGVGYSALLCGRYGVLGGCLLDLVNRAQQKFNVMFWSLDMVRVARSCTVGSGIL